jgi:hypothetical protein
MLSLIRSLMRATAPLMGTHGLAFAEVRRWHAESVRHIDREDLHFTSTMAARTIQQAVRTQFHRSRSRLQRNRQSKRHVFHAVSFQTARSLVGTHGLAFAKVRTWHAESVRHTNSPAGRAHSRTPRATPSMPSVSKPSVAHALMRATSPLLGTRGRCVRMSACSTASK